MAGTITLFDEDRRAPFDDLVGQQVGSYRIARLLGKGGMGAVYLARHPGIGSQVAVKFLHPRFANDRSVVERFFNEARAVNLIGHENIVKILDFSVDAQGRYFFVMEYLDGRPLSSLIAEGRPVPLSVAGPILLQCCRALQAAHERHIVHRDLKPDNLFLLSQMGRKHFVKIVDFGIAKLVDPAQPGSTEAGAVIGTPEYMSPEQAAGRSAEVGRRSDVYSLGVVMYQLATGRVPFSGPSTAETLVAHLQRPPAPPRTLEPSVPASYEAVILRALAKKKDDRFASMADLHDAIRACLREQSLSEELPLDDAPAPAARPQVAETPAPAPAPLTGTFLGERAPLSDRAARFGDWALAPSRRLPTLTLLLALVAGGSFLLLSRSPPGTRAGAPRAEVARSDSSRTEPSRLEPSRLEPSRLEPSRLEPPRTEPPRTGSSRADSSRTAPPSGVAKPAEATRPAEPRPDATRPGAARADAVRPAGPPPAQVSATSKPPAHGPRHAAPLAVAAVQQPASSRKPQPAKPATPAPARGPEASTASAAAEAHAASAARTQAEAAAAEAAKADAAQPRPPPAVRLFVVSDPPGSSVSAAWSGKSATGQTPMVFKVRRDAAVTLTFSRDGYAPVVRTIAAHAPQAVAVDLQRK